MADETSADTTSPDPTPQDAPEAPAAPVAPEPPDFLFSDLELAPELLSALTALGYEEPTPIQREAIPPVLAGKDILGQAATGTGKTAAFALPVLDRISRSERTKRPTALVLVPTRELCMQVSEAFHRYGKAIGARVLPIYGGQPIGRQLKELERGVDVVVATPGRALDHVQRGTLKPELFTTVVLDEADEMLDMGFADELENILANTPKDRQTLLFSATMPRSIRGLADRHLTNPVVIEIARARPAEGEGPKISQSAYIVARAHKAAALVRILDVEAPEAAIVFCRTRDDVDRLSETLNGRGYRAEALHGGMTQEARDRVMGRVRAQTADLLVATDVAARGLDIDHLTHVVNFDVPSAPESYVHRIGRVGRGGRTGIAITLAEPREHRMLKTIEKVTRAKIDIRTVPTVADLNARRVELTRAGLRESLLADDLERFRGVMEALSDEFDVVQVALAAIKLAHESLNPTSDDDADEIPTAAAARERDASSPRPIGYQGASTGGYQGAKSGPPRAQRAGMVKLFIGAGRNAGMRPQDLVGAIAGESSLKGRDIGAIEIQERFSLVEVPGESANEVIAALQATTLKNKKPQIRLERPARQGR